eukprot:TRINITY_DN22442_c0_g1_i1.p1 TRINITY_DN22442_c0_g1~~TRINITY_DN22442_c0_g1_i1.p1  ORF type:complete len:599 (+),score=91.52 TRINITY_DN22442_c0_g1_i1:83-1879(+)
MQESALAAARRLLLLQALLACQAGGQQAAEVSVPFAQAALWAANLEGLRKCDAGIDDANCPAVPEHGGPGFLSSVFTWRYALNNLRAALVAAPAQGGQAPPEGAMQMTLQLLGLLDQLMERPILDAFGAVAQQARALFDALQEFLRAAPAVRGVLPPPEPLRAQSIRRWTWPSDGKTSVSDAAFTLRAGLKMPAVGFGTWRLWGKQAYEPVRWALEAGYRHIDTAEGYANEEVIGQAIRDSGVPRESLFIATKASAVPKGLADMSYTEDIFNMQLQQLGVDYVDLYMLHTPPQDQEQLKRLWGILEGIYMKGRAKALGISNCDPDDLQTVFSVARVAPVYIQNLFKIYKPGTQMQRDGVDDIVMLAQANEITVMGYSVQTEWPHVMSPLDDPHVVAIAKQLGRSPSQVLHRWTLQRGVGVIPKSATRERIIENARLFDFEIPENQMRILDGLATLSESGASSPTKPSHQEDVFGLRYSANTQGAVASQETAQSAPPSAANRPAWGTSPDHGSPELLERTRNQGFKYTEIQGALLGVPSDRSPGACQQACLANQQCTAWEVCAPLDAQAGCGGCYLIGNPAPQSTTYTGGWHAAIERAR